MFPVLQVGPLTLQTPGLFLLIGVWLGVTLAERQAPRHGLSGEMIDRLTMISLVVGVVGARLAFAARNADAFAQSPWSLVSPNPGLFDPSAGVLAGLLAIAIYASKKRISLGSVVDSLTPAFAIAFIAMGLAQLADGSAYGAPTSLPWGIDLWGALRHPTQAYALLAGLLILGIDQWLIFRKREIPLPVGLRFLAFVSLTAFTRIIIEAFRGDSALIFNQYRQAQVIAWLVLAVTLFLIGKITSRPSTLEGSHERKSAA